MEHYITIIMIRVRTCSNSRRKMAVVRILVRKDTKNSNTSTSINSRNHQDEHNGTSSSTT